MAFKKDDAVKQVVHPITGTVTSKRFNEDTDSFEYLVSYTGADGNVTERWFTESEVEAA
jgi:hypothetical protein